MSARRVIRRGGAVALIAVAALGVATASSGAGAAKATKQVGVFDDYFDRETVRIRKGDRVKWVWDDLAVHPHNVTATDTPNGVKKFHSDDLTAPATYGHRFRKKGRYKLVCTIHSGSMRMKVRVRG